MNNTHFIRLKNVSLNYPILSGEGNSLRGLLRQTTSRKSNHIGTEENGNRYVKGLTDISLEVEEGDRIGLLGSNGAGKTTLLKTIAGIYLPSAGELKVNGRVSSLLDMGLGLDEDASGVENIYLAGYLRGRSKQETAAVLDDIIEFTEIGDFIHLPVRAYSSGMRTRLAFSIATAIVPDILLIDEVIGTGDEKFIQKSKKRMEAIMSKASILVFASHNNSLVMDYCNKGAVFEEGKMVFCGDVGDAVDCHMKMMSE
ncbi:ABC transporter ATP-binding protein [Thalassospira xiamenensis]|uniref:ABC transporter domain-containing protein n=1 Tax=Thalassospira xiamenensis TaxID=220697 RepID=A0ABR5Y4D6_9PROT|nr:ABC transporter ATP-binding protein [Thalassospira xiamenensis]KZD05698.1 hypothetical protein AUP40_11870 [Thalassospira xiamenensis]KZD09618.1 hypothetical protein AUP45_13090 [Thalassospira xiamenensis]MCD1595237.1 ABC transporter ATP-binding protein [Thalassospira xiamenensis]